MYRTEIQSEGAVIDRCVRLIDGTNLYIEKDQGQREKYSGHKIRNGFKMKSISTPDGIIMNIDDPIEAGRQI